MLDIGFVNDVLTMLLGLCSLLRVVKRVLLNTNGRVYYMKQLRYIVSEDAVGFFIYKLAYLNTKMLPHLIRLALVDTEIRCVNNWLIVYIHQF